ncbi:MAG TPA: patatin-like phospholipase family protein [Xanthobacteraceae bacterium]|nr:patatin-like phospholipase family protein [Xanthobacteraceae bacterium]
MKEQVQSDFTAAERYHSFERVALVLQGGGALGAYQAGVYEALAEAGTHPDWIAGVSVGAINGGIIAGNPPKSRIDKLREFWTRVTADAFLPCFDGVARAAARGNIARHIFNQLSAGRALASGAKDFFTTRPILPWFQPLGTIEATSFYDTRDLKRTLEQLVDFDRLNAGAIRFSAGAVNVRTGNFVYFDTTMRTIRPEHVMASAALPPGFPAIEIEGEHYWDGGLVSNTPLQWVVDAEPRRDTLAFQVDLWSARGEFPRNVSEVMTREKEIRYSSRTRAGTDQFKHVQKMRHALAGLLEKLPQDLKSGPEARALASVADRSAYNIVQLIYRTQSYEGHSKDYEFSRLSMEEHWRAGYRDARRALRHSEVLERPASREGVLTFDLHRDGRD